MPEKWKSKYLLNFKKESKPKDDLSQLNTLLTASTMNIALKVDFIKDVKQKLLAINILIEDPILKKSIRSILKDIDVEIRQEPVWEGFVPNFRQVHGDFLKRLKEKFPELTAQDLKLCAFLRLQLDTKQIAQLLGISVRGVEIARYRLRKRLQLKTKENLATFIIEF